MMSPIYVRTWGEGRRVLVLLHGLGANGEVWNNFLPHVTAWPGRILVPDLRGHGRSPHAPVYTGAGHAEDVASFLRDDDEVYVIGHSMGGIVGLMLGAASRLFDVKCVFAFGVKANWTDEERAKAAAYANAPVKVFATRQEAEERFLRAGGLQDLAPREAAVVQAGLSEAANGVRLAADPKTVLVGFPTLEEAFAACRGNKRLGCGRNDQLVNLEQLLPIDPRAVDLGTVGHNAHVQDPGAIRTAFSSLFIL